MLVAFYLFSMISAIGILWFPYSDRALPLLLIRSDNVEFEIGRAVRENRDLPDWWITSAQALHRGNAAVLRELGMYEYRHNKVGTALELLRKVITLEPKNIQNHINYFQARDQTSHPVTLSDEIAMLSQAYLSGSLFQSVIRGLRMYPPKAENVTGVRRFDLTRMHTYTVEGVLAMSFYIYGASLLDTNPQGTLYWWNMAVDADPGSSWYANAVASFQFQELRDRGGAKKTIMNCMKNAYDRSGCDQTAAAGLIIPYWYYHELIIPYLPLTSR